MKRANEESISKDSIDDGSIFPKKLKLILPQNLEVFLITNLENPFHRFDCSFSDDVIWNTTVDLMSEADSLWNNAKKSYDEEGNYSEDHTEAFKLYRYAFVLLKYKKGIESEKFHLFYQYIKTIAKTYYKFKHYLASIECFNTVLTLGKSKHAELIKFYEQNFENNLNKIEFNMHLAEFHYILSGSEDNEKWQKEKGKKIDLKGQVIPYFFNKLISERHTGNQYDLLSQISLLLLSVARYCHEISSYYINKIRTKRDEQYIRWMIENILSKEQLTHLVFSLDANILVDSSIQDFCDAISPPLTEMQQSIVESYSPEDEPIDILIGLTLDKIQQFKDEGYYEKLTLRPHQERTFSAWERHLRLGHNVGYFVKATGTGKTRDFSSFCMATVSADFRIIILEPSNFLVYETIDKLKLLAEQIGKSVSISNKIANKFATPIEILVITFHLYYVEMNKIESQRKLDIKLYKMLVRDEAHIGLNKLQKLHNYTNLKDSNIVLACTASSKYNTYRPVGGFHSLEECYGEGNQFDYYPLIQAIEERELSPVHVCMIVTDTELKPNYHSRSNDKLVEITEREAEYKINNTSLNNVAIEIYLNVTHPDTGKNIFGTQSVFFCAGVKHAKAMAKQINQHLSALPFYANSGIKPAVAMTGDLNSKSQQKILRDFQEGHVSILCGSDLIITGIDNPNIISIFNLRPTCSEVLALQRFGRALRLSEFDPQKIALIFEFNWNIPGQIYAINFMNKEPRLGYVKNKFSIEENIPSILTSNDVTTKLDDTSAWELNWEGIIEDSVYVPKNTIPQISSRPIYQGIGFFSGFFPSRIPYSPSYPVMPPLLPFDEPKKPDFPHQ